MGLWLASKNALLSVMFIGMLYEEKLLLALLCLSFIQTFYPNFFFSREKVHIQCLVFVGA